jgi:ABC-type Fe3+ transport system substrate-binding protein
MQQYGRSWFDRLLAQNPRWVRGTATPRTILTQPNTTWAATFTTSGLASSGAVNVTHPVQGSFVTWFQLAAIPKDAPHPEGAKLFHNYMLSKEWQSTRGGWPVRQDLPPPQGYPPLFEMPGTDVTYFSKWMADRARLERLKNWFEDKLGTPQGLSPLEDGI